MSNPGSLTKPVRDYVSVEERARFVPGDHAARMARVVDMLWEELRGKGCSWLGFYTISEGADGMLLGPCRDKPACTPLGLHGMCGRSWRNQSAVVVNDVRKHGDGHIVCDPKNLSEVVVPCLTEGGGCWGVLDLDSYDVGSFDEDDARSLNRVLDAAGLSVGRERLNIEVL